MVVGVVFFDPQDGFAQNTVGHYILVLARASIGQAGNVLLKGGCESGRRRKEPFLEQLVDERRAERIADLFGILAAARAVVVEFLVNGALLRGVQSQQRLQLALCIERPTFGIDQIALEAADHDLTQLLFIGQDVSSETLVVQQLQQRCERFCITVVRSGC